MFKFNPKINNKIGDILLPITIYLHNNLGITPNQVSIASFIVGLIALPFILSHNLKLGLIFMLISLILDGLDGPIARQFGYNLQFGEKLDTIIDRTLEIVIFSSLSYAGYVDFRIVILSIISILLMTSLRNKAKFDPGLKRIMLLFGYFTNFHFAFTIIFLANLLGFIINLLILEIRQQKKIDIYTCN